MIAFQQDLIAHLEQHGVTLADDLHRTVTPLHFDHPDVQLPLHHEARLVDGRYMRVDRAERRIALDRALHRYRRRGFDEVPVPDREYRAAIRQQTGTADG